MPSALINAMIEKYDYAIVNENNVDNFAATYEECVLFFTENPTRFPESDDVAMILPELVKAYSGRFQAAVVEQASQRQLQARYGFTEWPTLVFLRNGGYLGAISRVQDWYDYLSRIDALLKSEPKPNPGVGIPVMSASTASSANTH